MVNMNIVLIIFLFITVCVLLKYNWSITNSVYDLEDELDEIYEHIDGIKECLKEIALTCDNNTEFITTLCDEILKEENEEVL